MKEHIKIPTNRNFGIVFFVVFLLISFYPLMVYGHQLKIWALIISIFFLFFGIINSKILLPFNILWFKFGLFLGKFFTPIILAIIFFIIVTPIAILIKILKKDLLCLNFSKNKSYWIKNNEEESDMKNQF